jgi:hypothetical protein
MGGVIGRRQGDKGEADAGDHPKISRFDFVRYDAPPKEKCR